MGLIAWLRGDDERHERHERRLNSLDQALKAVGTSTLARLDRIEKDQKDYAEKRTTELASVRSMICTHKDDNAQALTRVEKKMDTVIDRLAKQDGLLALALRLGNWGYRLLVTFTCLSVVSVLGFVAWRHPELLPALIKILAAAIPGGH